MYFFNPAPDWVRLNAGEVFWRFSPNKMYKFSHLLNNVGMENKKPVNARLDPRETELLEKLRRQPKIMARVRQILEIAQSSDGPLKTADEVEELLVEELRRLGNTAMSEWAAQAHERVSDELQAREPTVLKRKKKR